MTRIIRKQKYQRLSKIEGRELENNFNCKALLGYISLSFPNGRVSRLAGFEVAGFSKFGGL